MNVSEQQSLEKIDIGSLGSVVGTQLGATLLNNKASKTSLHLPLISPEVIKLSGIRPNDDSQEFNDDNIGISPRYTFRLIVAINNDLIHQVHTVLDTIVLLLCNTTI